MDIDTYMETDQNCPRVTFLGPDPAKRWPDPTRDCWRKVWPDPTPLHISGVARKLRLRGQYRKVPSPPAPLTARGSGERCKLPQWGLGRSPSRQRFWCILDQKGSFWCDLNLPQWRSQEIEIGGKFIVPSYPSSPAVFRTRWASLVGSGAGAPAANDFGVLSDQKERFLCH